LVEDPPYLIAERAKGRPRIDYSGLGRLVIGIGYLQLVLDKGQEKDWFSTTWITALIRGSHLYADRVGSLEYYHPLPIVEIRLFRNRNFSTVMFLTFVLGIVLSGATVVIPQFLQLLLGYPAQTSGGAMAGGGFMMRLMMPIAGQLVSPRGSARPDVL
jgi:DHA2 family multidrug resistance protein